MVRHVFYNKWWFMNNAEKKYVDRLMSLATSILLLLYSLRYLANLFDFNDMPLLIIWISFSGVLYFIASILLIFDFLSINILWVKKKVWLPLYLIGFAPKIIMFIFLCSERWSFFKYNLIRQTTLYANRIYTTAATYG